MKKVIFYALSLTMLVFGQTFAQSVAEQNLDAAIQSAENVQQEVVSSRKAVNLLVKQLTVLGNPNATLFSDKMHYHVNQVQNQADEIDYFVALAKSNSIIDFSTTAITALTTDLVNQNDILLNLTNQMTAAVQANNTTLALSLVTPIRSALTRQYNKSGNIIIKIGIIKQSIKTYNVCIKTVDNAGNPTSYNAGFYCQNTATGEYIYTDNQEGTCFSNMLPGTYDFGSFQDYFCGTSSQTVTLSNTLVNANGIIEVTLVVWCE